MPSSSGLVSLLYPPFFSLILAGLVGAVFWSQGFFRLPPSTSNHSLRFWHLLSGFAIYAGLNFVVPLLLFIVAPQITTDSYGISWTFLAIVALSLCALFFLARAFARPVQEEIFGKSLSPLKDIGLGALTYLIAYPLTNFVSQVVYLILTLAQGSYLPHAQVAIAHLKSTAEFPLVYFLTLISFAFIVPIIEEFLFRGLLQRWLLARLKSRSFACLLTAFLFALVHYSKVQGATNFELLSSIFVLGLFLGFIREKRSLFASIGLHATFNTTSLLYITFG